MFASQSPACRQRRRQQKRTQKQRSVEEQIENQPGRGGSDQSVAERIRAGEVEEYISGQADGESRVAGDKFQEQREGRHGDFEAGFHGVSLLRFATMTKRMLSNSAEGRSSPERYRALEKRFGASST